jgi:hypothetical protein
VNLIDTIPGIDRSAAITLLAEITPRVAEYFSSDAKLASWVGGAPGNNKSAGVKKAARSLQGNKYAKGILCQCAWANCRSQNRIGAHFRRIRKRRGEQKAAVATAHLIIRIVYAILRDRVEYRHIEQTMFEDSTAKMAERFKKPKVIPWCGGSFFFAFYRYAFSYKRFSVSLQPPLDGPAALDMQPVSCVQFRV